MRAEDTETSSSSLEPPLSLDDSPAERPRPRGLFNRSQDSTGGVSEFSKISFARLPRGPEEGLGTTSGSEALLSLAQPELPDAGTHRTFFPGQTYKPEDLADESFTQKPPSSPLLPPERKDPAEVADELDYKNIALLREYIGASGRLTPRRFTRLPAKDDSEYEDEYEDEDDSEYEDEDDSEYEDLDDSEFEEEDDGSENEEEYDDEEDFDDENDDEEETDDEEYESEYEDDEEEWGEEEFDDEDEDQLTEEQKKALEEEVEQFLKELGDEEEEEDEEKSFFSSSVSGKEPLLTGGNKSR
ncbi:hypothetical protein CYMTET_7861 [Cymbomonas tetramitiformis]|uniref:Small ribosomal subunit protein bS18c n=1 Tax=Cymbomonas tetramitiformis TaxID=36881 RepID=A0AAE0LH16_9CHLO|nr:hypothetical protein CYMTET_7861 [Cymbomonas tetramitiformis]